ncbi:MAG: DUF3267 domain-containing protein [Hymenobacteraceae bacterium]|nr:DUF3267 domain-containing protein [Hymenobacteraceae bacterium]
MKEQDLRQQGIGYRKIELTVSAAKANMYALYFILPILLLYIPAYLLVWPEQFALQNLRAVLQQYKVWLLFSPLVMLGVFVVGAVVHELLHGLTWGLFCKDGLKSIKYGVYWKLLTPYCHCKEVLPLGPYVLGGLMPGLVMGLLPALAGLIWGNFLLFLFGLFFSVAAGGDLLVLWMLRRQKKEDLVQDHPEKIGCYVLIKDQK